ncbi:MAG: hypothetical protein IH621_08425 [Krumholzibacteria bacterium]|nr:hypothetical protein [Candidatus Krumholzibacteria bacterium]
MIRSLTIVLVIAALGLPAGDAAAFFETTQVSPRARAMGETGVASPDAAWAPFLNPAALGTATGGEAAASYQRPFRLDFTDFVAVGVGLPFDTRFGRFGLGLSSFSVSWADGDSGEDVDLLKETRLTFAHGVDLYSDYHSTVAVGWAANVYRVEAGESVSGIDPGSAATVGLDVGMLFTLHRRTRLALQVVNINDPRIGQDNEELARRLVAGASYEPGDGVVTSFEIDNQLGQDVVYKGGLEAYVVPGFALRTGVATNPNRLTGGFGYTMRGFSLDYGFSTGGGTLDSTHQFGLVYAWGGEAQ